MIDPDTILAGLNEAQREAVLATEGPLLILAGAGSGKTRVITHRLAYLIASGRTPPGGIIAVTFTNKAAGEMKERVIALLGAEAEGSRVGTFHALCLRILRREGARAGLPSGFQVFDTADQLAVLRAVMKELDIDEGEFPPRGLLSRISHAKNRFSSPEEVAARATYPEGRVLAACLPAYQERLRSSGGVDFDDLLLETLRLLEEDPDAGRRYASACRYLLVDEYQDTNRIQYRLIRALSGTHGNLCCVGDHDQSIYRFRGADSANIRDFERDHPGARIVKLERNYRSTRAILRAAGSVIEKNERLHPTRLWTENEEGLPIHLHRARDDRDESEAIVRIVASLSRTFPTGEIAVLYRTNNQSRLIEEAFVRAGVRYRIVGSLRFYERKEIKDLLAYLRLLVSPADDISFVRASGSPPRGIGKVTLEQLAVLAQARGVSLHEAAEQSLREPGAAGRSAAPLRAFLEVLAGLRQEGSHSMVSLITSLVAAIGFREHLEKAHPGDHEDRLENVEALVSAAAEYDEQEPGGGLQGFLDRSSLRSDTDDVQGNTGVTLLTVHSAKGLEFGAVVLAGLEENLFPHIRSAASAEEIEEERRLCYVALTRAKKRLVLTNAVMRRSFGDFVENPPSRFLGEIPRDLLVYSESSPWTGVVGDPLQKGLGPSDMREVAWPGGASAGAGRGFGGRDWGTGRGRPGGGPGARGAGSASRERRPTGASAHDDFAVGRVVTHPMFGRGTILHKEGAGEGLKLTIRFRDAGTKKILPRHTTLVVLDPYP